MSPRAACRLDTLGFEHVYDYLTGKFDWLARGLPREGENAAEPRAVDFARRDVVTCRLHDRVGAVRERVDGSPFGFAFVVSDGEVLLGRLRKTALEGDPDATAEMVMEPGASTARDTAPARLRERLQRSNLTTAVVTDPDGRLLGVVRRECLSPVTSIGELGGSGVGRDFVRRTGSGGGRGGRRRLGGAARSRSGSGRAMR